MSKKNIAVIFGGCSTEYEVSLQSAFSILKVLEGMENYNIICLGITREGAWYRYLGPLSEIEKGTWQENKELLHPALISPDRSLRGMIEFTKKGMKTIRLHGAFPVLHGKNGEDGTVQGLIELAGIPLIGCDTESSALCMDKDRAHRLVKEAGIKVPKAVLFTRREEDEAVLKKVSGLSFPLFVKPVKAGSSFGITKVYQEEELLPAIEEAFRHDGEVLVEENITGFEVGCAVMGRDNLIIGEVDEIELTEGFFDYTEKYTLKSAVIHMPARIDHETGKRIKASAALIYKTLGCKGFARVDMFLTEKKEIVFNEVNTIPGFTSHSRYPGMMKGIGLSYADIISRLIAEEVG
ncbi:D-alanine--D-serine ligase VanG [Anaerocolumna xylanovorans]|uniref:D-alanine--D-alanine ligase n=1 Tax=Anaerocolumna xylanovorans DSM 12503 TaxID=1121345 RepID=A0A1M7XZ03_9FIRM|nr:D-alanine--D-serine ligase VanG [Anaerocolumna xylanovorans]SHO44335.1 D-alanine---D-serine ligase [Anaerocolumna xylanovorans DSM 12503]